MKLNDNWLGLGAGAVIVFVVMAVRLLESGQLFYAFICAGLAVFLARDLAGLFFRSAGRAARRNAFMASDVWVDRPEFSSSRSDGSVRVTLPSEKYFRTAFNGIPVAVAGSLVSSEGLGFDLFSDDGLGAGVTQINPATGLPMTNGVDVAGNVFGSDAMSPFTDDPQSFDSGLSSDMAGFK
jgi:hypothetical protein